jgi:hypothetical protein
MLKKLKPSLFCIALLCSLLFTACADKVDKTLDKYEDVISKYEDMAKNKTLTDQDITDMTTQLGTLGQDFAADGGVALDPDKWSDKQKARYIQLQARSEKLSMSIMTGN